MRLSRSEECMCVCCVTMVTSSRIAVYPRWTGGLRLVYPVVLCLHIRVCDMSVNMLK